MSDMFVHWAVFDDCRRLAPLDTGIDPFLSSTIQTHAEHARLGALTRSGQTVVPHVLREAIAHKQEYAQSLRLQQKVAFALGMITHYAADFIMKPLMSRLARADWNSTHDLMQKEKMREAAAKSKKGVSVREISAYYDTYVFRKVYLDGSDGVFANVMLSRNVTEPGKALEDFVRSLFQRSLLLCHTLSPQSEDPSGWLDRLFDTIQPLYLDIEQYVDIYTRPNPDKMAVFEVESTFYHEDDPVIMCARSTQHGRAVSAEEICAALADNVNRSAYGQALALAIRRLRETSQFWNGTRAEGPDLKQ